MNQPVRFGKSLQFKGDLTGNEDLMIEGKVEGKIFLKDHKLTIGANGQIKAEVHAESAVVAGKLIGNIEASDKVEIAATGSMEGNISAPRVVLADGARFKGSIDMGPKSAAAGAAASPPMAAAVGKSSGSGTPSSSGLSQNASAAKAR